MKSEPQRESPTQDENKEEDSPSSADIKDPENYDQIFHPKKRICKFMNLKGTRVNLFSMIFLKTQDTIGNCQRPVFLLDVSQSMHIKNKPVNNKKMKKNEKNCHTKLCAFQMLDFETSKSNSEVSKSNLWKITSVSKTTLLQMELFSTMIPSCQQLVTSVAAIWCGK